MPQEWARRVPSAPLFTVREDQYTDQYNIFYEYYRSVKRTARIKFTHTAFVYGFPLLFVIIRQTESLHNKFGLLEDR